MTAEPYQIPKRLFVFYLREIEGLNKKHRSEVANIIESIAKEMGDPMKLTFEDFDEVGAPAAWKWALPYYRRFMENFLPKVKHRKGAPLSFKHLAIEYNISVNQVKRIFHHFLVDYHKDKADYVTMDGYLVKYVMPRKELALFKEYLKREARKDVRRARTYADFIKEEEARNASKTFKGVGWNG